MKRTIDIYRTLGVRKEEGADVFLFVLFSFFMGLAVYIYYIVATSLFLTNFEKSTLPTVYIAGGVLLYLLGRLNSSLQAHVRFFRLSFALLAFFISSLVILLLGYQLGGGKWITLGMFLWIRITVYIGTVTLWIPASAIFNLQQAKRLFSLIGMGDVLASILSSFLVSLLVGGGFLKTENMLYVCVFSLAAALTVMFLIVKRHRQALSFKKTEPLEEEVAGTGKVSKRYFKNNYYLLVFLLAMMPIFGLYILEFIFSIEIKAQFPHKDQMSAFLGKFLFFCALVELIVKVYFYRFIINAFGIISGIIILPLLLLVVMALAAVTASMDLSFFFYILLGRFLLSSVRKSFTDTSFQILYQPLPKSDSVGLQGQVEVHAKPLGYVVAGFLLLGMVYFGLGNSMSVIYVFLVVLAGWLFLSFRMKAEYHNMLSGLFKFPSRQPVSEAGLPQEGHHAHTASRISFDSVIERSMSDDDAVKLEGIALLGKSKRFLSFKYLIPHLQSKDEAIRLAAIEAAGENGNPELWSILLDHLQIGLDTRETSRALVRIGEPVIPAISQFFGQSLERVDIQLICVAIVTDIGGPKAVKFLRQQLNAPSQLVRDKVFESLASMHYQANLGESAVLVQEVRLHIQFVIWLIAARHDMFKDRAVGQKVSTALAADYDQATAKVLNILALLTGDSRLFYLHGSMTSQEENTRSYLLEVLNIAIPEEHKWRVLPLFDETSWSEKLLKFRSEFPQQTLSPVERLYDILNKDFARLSVATKRAAILELEQFPSEQTSFILAACAVAPTTAVAETALEVLWKTDREKFDEVHRNMLLKHDSTGIAIAAQVMARDNHALILPIE
jgi:AAA family ATP:ADP antiporter